jgi:hypothetical protein
MALPSTIDLTLVHDLQHQHDQFLAFQFTHGAVVTATVSPQTALVATQRLAQFSWVFGRQYTVAENASMRCYYSEV